MTKEDVEFVPKHWRLFRQWLTEPLGQTFIATEAKEVGELTAKLFGFHVLLVGEGAFAKALKGSLIPHKIWVHPHVENIEEFSSLSPLATRQDKLPILSDEIDLVYLSHCLEFLQNPHETLREAYRVLKPEGHVVITCFNPWSVWGFYRWMMHYLDQVPWDGRFISLFRLKDWLALLGFDVIEVRHCFFRPPFQNESWLKKLSWLEKIGRWFWPFWSGDYIVLAQKRVLTLTPIKAPWKLRERELRPGIVEPAARQ